MRIKFLYYRVIRLIAYFFILFGLHIHSVSAQAVYENVQNSIYIFLYRQAQKGNIELSDLVRPLTRNDIAFYLNQLNRLSHSDAKNLTSIDLRDLAFYIQEYGLGVGTSDNSKQPVKVVSKDARGRFRFFHLIDTVSSAAPGVAKLKPFQLSIEPIAQLSINSNADSLHVKRVSGAMIWGSLGKHIGFTSYLKDVYESGSGIDFERKFTPESGYVPATNPTEKSLNYSDVRASVVYQWQSGLLSVGKDQYVTGYGLSGNIIHSSKPPSFPYVRFRQKVLPWLSFEYIHAFLNSRLIDTPNSYRVQNMGVYGGEKFKLIPKYFVSHAANVRITKKINFSIGESVIYNDRLQFGYWIPFMFFKAWDQYFAGNNLNLGANTQLFAQLSSRNNIKNTHLFLSLLVDEISPSQIFDKERSRNQLAFQVGGSKTDLFGINNLTYSAEYTRVNPFVYQNLMPAQSYTNNEFLMGDWMGANSDRFVNEIFYSPASRFQIRIQNSFIRKGDIGTIAQQYFAQPQPRFLFNRQFHLQIHRLQFQYELINNLFLKGFAEFQQRKSFVDLSGSKMTRVLNTSVGAFFNW
jgi:hypothetical protein